MNAAQFFDHWNKVWRDLMLAVLMLKDKDLGFRPSEHYQRSVGDNLRHIINVEQGWVLGHVFEQEIHHRGELYLCLSLLGYDRLKTDRLGQRAIV